MCPRIAGYLLLAAVAVLPVFPQAAQSAESADSSSQAPVTSRGPAGIADASQPADVPSLIKAIHSDSFHVREQASEKLLRLAPEQLSEIERALSTETDAEAISRLSTVALHLYLKDPRITPLQGKAGLLGISLSVEPVAVPDKANPPLELIGQVSIVVLDTKPGFPSYEVLKPGDRIMEVDDKPLALGYSVETFRQKVADSTPGSFINMTVLRDGKKFRAPVQVAGLERKGDDFITNYVEGRMRLGATYLAQLRTGKSPAPLVIVDHTPPEVNIYNDFEFEAP